MFFFSSCFSFRVEDLLARQFTVDCSQRENSIFFSCLSFHVEVLGRQFTVDCSQGENSIFFSLRVFHFTMKFSSRDSSPWTVLKGRIIFFFCSWLSFHVEVLRARQFTVDCSQGENYIFFLFVAFISR